MEPKIDCIESIPEKELKELSIALADKIKEAKKKYTGLLKKDPQLMKKQSEKLGIDPPGLTQEEILEVRNKRKKDFDLALLANPEAFFAFQTNAFLMKLSDTLRAEHQRRSIKPSSIEQTQQLPEPQ
jgi:hypothetical protein